MSKIHLYYLPTFFKEKDPNDTTCTLFVRKYKQYITKSGKDALAYALDVIQYPSEEAMAEDIKAKEMKELPEEADGNPSYVPEHLKTVYMRKVQSL